MDNKKTIYACLIRNCRFLFESQVEPERCPDCGKKIFRKANKEEIFEFEKRKDDFNKF